MTVPLSDAVARMVPVELIERKEIGALCAWITFATVSDRVEKRRTSPDCCVEVACGGWVRLEEVGDGTVEGYARYELSEEGDNATMAAQGMSQGHPKKTFVRPHTFRVWGGFYDMKQAHIRNVVYVNLCFENNDEGFPVQFDRKY